MLFFTRLLVMKARNKNSCPVYSITENSTAENSTTENTTAENSTTGNSTAENSAPRKFPQRKNFNPEKFHYRKIPSTVNFTIPIKKTFVSGYVWLGSILNFNESIFHNYCSL